MAITIYKALNFSENLLAGWDWADFIYLKDTFLSNQLYVKGIYKAGILEFIDDELYTIIAKIVVANKWRDVIEAYKLKKGSWVQVNPKNIIINEEWKALTTFGTYDGG